MSEKWLEKWEKAIYIFKKIYSPLPLKDSLFRYRCWFFYPLMIFYALIFVPLILLTIISGAQINLHSEYKIIFPLSLFFFIELIISIWFNNWISKSTQFDIIKKYKKYMFFCFLFVSPWTIIFLKKVENKNEV